ncbi:MAG: hypothetical protein LBT66_08960 [Methanobrevibacter sp.]|jgi:hypothetical protein|nr:hypothetical protein [Candidatus Methanovirga meridionalis]
MTKNSEAKTKNIEANAQKKFKSRIRKFKKVLKDDIEKEEFLETLAASVEIFLPAKKPDEVDSIIIYTTADGKVTDGEYAYTEGDDIHASLPISDKDLDIFIEAFKNFKLE